MKNLLFLLVLVTTTATAQLDLSAVNLVDDSTMVSVQKDTAYFLVETGVKQREGKEPVTLYRASLITVVGGQTYANLTSGIVTHKQMKEWLRSQRDGWIEGDIKKSQEIITQYQRLKAQINNLVK